MKRPFNPLQLRFFANNKPLENKAYGRSSRLVLLSLPLKERKTLKFGKEELMIGDIFEANDEYYIISLKEVPYNETIAQKQYIYNFYGLAAILLNKEYKKEIIDYILDNQRDITKLKHTKYNFIGNIFIDKQKDLEKELNNEEYIGVLNKIKVSMGEHMNNLYILYNDKDNNDKRKITKNLKDLSIEDFIIMKNNIIYSHFDLYLHYRKGLSLYSNTFISNEEQTYFTGINEYGQIVIFTNQDMEHHRLLDINDESAIIYWYDLSDNDMKKAFEKELLLYVSEI